jgi:hypothetical protein
MAKRTPNRVGVQAMLIRRRVTATNCRKPSLESNGFIGLAMRNRGKVPPEGHQAVPKPKMTNAIRHLAFAQFGIITGQFPFATC